MFSSSFKRLAALLSALSVITSAVSVPLASPSEEVVETHSLVRRLVTSAPRFVVYQSAVFPRFQLAVTKAKTL